MSFSKYFIKVIIYTLLAIIVVSCKKDESNEETKPALSDQIIGTWRITEGDYIAIIGIDDNFTLRDYFVEDTLSGAGEFTYRLNGNTLTMDLYASFGDYFYHSDLSVGSSIDITVSVANEQLIITSEGEEYVYDKMPDNEIIDGSELYGSWQNIEGDNKDILTLSGYDGGYRRLTNISISPSDISAAQILWEINGNMIMVYYAGEIIGNYLENNEVQSMDAKLVFVDVSNNNVTFTVDGDSNIYTKITETEVINNEDITGAWQITNGDYYEVLTLNDGAYGDNSIINGSTSAGSSKYFFWITAGNYMTIQYRNNIGDYTNITGIERNDIVLYKVDYDGSKLSFTDDGNTYSYNPLSLHKTYNDTILFGKWECTDSDFYGVLEFIESESSTKYGTDAFKAAADTGSAEFQWFVTGDILTVDYYLTTGEYDIYKGLSVDKDFHISTFDITGNTLTIYYEDDDYIYTKMP